MVFSLLGCKKQQSSLHAPWAQVCNENRSTAITQNLCLSTHSEPYMRVFSGSFWCVCTRLLFLSVPNEAMQRVWGGGGGGVEGEAGGRRMLGENTVCPHREWRSEFKIHCKERAVFDGLLLLSFVTVPKPRRTSKVKPAWLILNLVKIPHCAPVYSMPFSKANREWHHGNSSIHGFSELQVNGAVGTGIKGRKKGKNGGGENCAPQHHHENPTGQRPRRGARDWENAPVPPTTASGWDKRRREEEEEDKDEGWSKMKDESQATHLTGSCAIRSESKLIYTSVLCVDGRWWITDAAPHWQYKPGLLCVGLLEQSGWSYASNVSSRACPVPEQLKFKPEALQLHWFSVQPASWLHSGSESLTAESKGTRTSRAADLEAPTGG